MPAPLYWQAQAARWRTRGAPGQLTKAPHGQRRTPPVANHHEGVGLETCPSQIVNCIRQPPSPFAHRQWSIANCQSSPIANRYRQSLSPTANRKFHDVRRIFKFCVTPYEPLSGELSLVTRFGDLESFSWNSLGSLEILGILAIRENSWDSWNSWNSSRILGNFAFLGNLRNS